MTPEYFMRHPDHIDPIRVGLNLQFRPFLTACVVSAGAYTRWMHEGGGIRAQAATSVSEHINEAVADRHRFYEAAFEYQDFMRARAELRYEWHPDTLRAWWGQSLIFEARRPTR